MYDNLDGRLRGRAAVKQRLRRLNAEPLCRHCREQDKLTPATVPDHIIPLSRGGTDEDSNIQCLCESCHTIKTALDGTTQGASNHPDWLKPSNIPLTIVCGPPCSGKTTYVNNHASPNDIIIDLDTIRARISPGFKPWDGKSFDRDLFNKSIRVRNATLASLHRQHTGRAWFIVSAPTEAERTWWQTKLGGQIVLLHPGKAECHRRAIDRGTPLAIHGIDQWERTSKQTWQPPRPKQQIGLDGWPVSPQYEGGRGA